jgi:hypothetical protein
MDGEATAKLVSSQIRFVASIEAECEKRHNNLEHWLNKCQTFDQAEHVLLEQVKFVGSLLEEIRRSNKFMEEKLGRSYAKLVGLGTPYEEAIHALRQVKLELDTYLKTIRDIMLEDMKKKINRRSYGKRKKD